MPIWVIVLITFGVAFWLGSSYKGTHHRGRSRFLLRTLVTIVAVCMSALALVGLIAFISPSLAITLASKLPPDIQEILFWDLILRGGTGLWVFIIISGALWWARTRI